MTQSLVLSLFPGIGLLDMAFEQEGFCIVRGPDLLWGGDIRRFHPPSGKFDGVIGGPPCQAFSSLRHLVEHVHGPDAVAEDLIPEFVRCVRLARPSWWLMENVPKAPLPVGTNYSTVRQFVRDVWVGGTTSRMRSFTFGADIHSVRRFAVVTLALYAPDPKPAVCSDARIVPAAVGGNGKRKKKPGVSRLSPGNGPRLSIAEMLARQGFAPDHLDYCPLTDRGKRQAIGNGVPFALGRAVAKAVKRALADTEVAA